jgi:glucosamine-6-phosphate deaminase
LRVIYAKDYQDVSRKAAGVIAAQVTLYPRSVLGLATGSTPIGTYERLAELCRGGELDFSGMRTVNLDEYCGLGPDDPQSYRYFMNEKLFQNINIDPANTYLPDGLADPEQECGRYDALVASLGGVDLQLLGIGHNGHIGFNEPGEAFVMGTNCVDLSEATIQANARFFSNPADVPRRAITMGMRTIMQAKRILLVVSGKDKADILQKALYGPVTPQVPASILQLHPDVIVVACIE